MREQLADGPRTAGELMALAAQYGIAPRTLQDSRRSIGASTAKQYAANEAGRRRLQAHVWQLREESAG